MFQVPQVAARRRPAGSARLAWLAAGGIALVAVVAIALVVALRPDESPAATGAGTRIAQFHYEFTTPDGWEQSGSDAESRETDLRPTEDAGTDDKILVKEFELSYDATAQRDKAISELREQYDRRRAGIDPPPVDGFDAGATFAGRDVLYYNEVVEAGTVDWYVVFQGKYQVSVGCQHGESGADRVRAACDHVVSTLAVHG